MTRQAAPDERADWRGYVAAIVERVGAVARRITPEFVRRRYAAKFAISMVVVLLVIGSIGGASYVQIQSSLRGDTQEQLQSRATMQATAVGGLVQEMTVQTRFISSASAMRADDRQQVGLPSRGTKPRDTGYRGDPCHRHRR